MTAVMAACGVVAVMSRRPVIRMVGGGLAVAVVGGPFIVVTLGAGVGLVALWRRARQADRSARRSKDDELLCVEITSLCVAAGLTFREAATRAGMSVGGSAGRDLVEEVRRSTVGAGTRTGVSGIDTMLAEAERSAVTGAPLARSLDSLASSLRSEQATLARERVAKLPVKLLFPLALLILPGFVLMTVGPAVLSGLSRIAL